MNNKRYCKLLHFNNLYIKKSEKVESIIKYGLHYGISSYIFCSCKDICELQNYNIKIYLLDIFKDFPFFCKNYLKNTTVRDI